jgi:NitT/TauT family transport system permease protein
VTIASTDELAAAAGPSAVPRSPVAGGDKRAILLLAAALITLNAALAVAGLWSDFAWLRSA